EGKVPAAAAVIEFKPQVLEENLLGEKAEFGSDIGHDEIHDVQSGDLERSLRHERTTPVSGVGDRAEPTVSRERCQAAGKPTEAVILSEAKNLALSVFKKIRRARSFAALRMTPVERFSAACEAPPFQTRGEKCGLLARLLLRASGAHALGRFVGLEEFSDARFLGVLIGDAQVDALEYLSEDARSARVFSRPAAKEILHLLA